MNLPLYKAIVRDQWVDGRIVGYDYLYYSDSTTDLEECALTRAYEQAIKTEKLQASDLAQVQFQLENGNPVTTTFTLKDAYSKFFEQSGLHVFGASQHMSEVGKVLVAKYDAKTVLEKLYSKDFADRLDLHKFLKLLQIMCQEGRLLGTQIKRPDGTYRVTEALHPYKAQVYVDTKHPEDDGIIFVSPDFWDNTILPSYTTASHPLAPTTSLIKVNSCDSDMTIKAVMKKSTELEWQALKDRCPGEFDIVLCGNAIKDNVKYQEDNIYEMNQDRFAYHTDSNIGRGYRVNISTQIMTRSGMNNDKFIDLASKDAIDMLSGLMICDEDVVIRAIGALTRDGKEKDKELEFASALRRRIMEHDLPANHPVNVLQIYRLGMSVIRENLRKINVSGFHGIGAPSSGPRGIVGVPTSVFKAWMREHGTNHSYLFRSPYLGSYCGRFVTLVPRDTDTILVNWEDALQTEGDFDGDQYYVVPAMYINSPDQANKPNRPAKAGKEVVTLTQSALQNEILVLATNKNGIGPRDRKLTLAFDRYNEAKARGDEQGVATWKRHIEDLQIWVQQAIEGLKHGTQSHLSTDQITAMFGKSPEVHPYTDLFGKRVLSGTNLHGSQGFISRAKQAVDSAFEWHPLHKLFVAISELEFGEVADLTPYFNCVKTVPNRVFDQQSRRELWRGIRDLHSKYAAGVNRWDGGLDRNIKFGADVLEPIKNSWNELMSRMSRNPQAIAEINMMLANVAYEPQPNWRLFGDGSNPAYPAGMFYKIKTRVAPINRLQQGQTKSVNYKVKKILVYGKVEKSAGKYNFTFRPLVPRTGALFHHLVDGQVSKDIFRSIQPDYLGDTIKRALQQAIK